MLPLAACVRMNHLCVVCDRFLSPIIHHLQNRFEEINGFSVSPVGQSVVVHLHPLIHDGATFGWLVG